MTDYVISRQDQWTFELGSQTFVAETEQYLYRQYTESHSYEGIEERSSFIF